MVLINQNIILKFWFFPLNLALRQITTKEENWVSKLTNKRKYEFRYSRGYTRIALSTIFNIDPLLIPLHAEPGKPPLLKKGFGYLSISHCNDALFVAWSNSKIGVDIESINRYVDAEKFSSYLLSEEEKHFIKYSNNQNTNENLLKIWVMKEALVKYTKGSILGDFKTWRIDFKNHLIYKSDRLVDINSNYFKYKSWLIGIASKTSLTKMPKVNCIY